MWLCLGRRLKKTVRLKMERFKIGDFVCTKNNSLNNKYEVKEKKTNMYVIFDNESKVTLWLPSRDLVLWDERNRDNDKEGQK
jgi:hypothetical protein